jgi:hypothetical protein
MVSSKTVQIKLLMGGVSIAISIAAYGIYLWQTSKAGGTQPHPFSWLLWGLATGVAYVVQASTGAGAGSWVSGFTAVMCIVIGLFSLFKHRWQFVIFDWLSLVAGLILLVYYLLAKNLLSSAIFATAMDVVGYGPTVKKGWAKPYDDSVSSFLLNCIKFIPALYALNSYSVTTWLYPSTLVFVNGAVALMLSLRRRKVAPDIHDCEPPPPRFNS